MEAGQPVPSSYRGGGLAIATDQTSDTDLSTGDFAYPIREFLDIFLSSAACMPRTYELRVVLEARWNGFRAMCVPFHKLDHLFFLLFAPPFLELLHCLEY